MSYLDAEAVTIAKATVSLQCIRIDKKAMSIAVFRQLPQTTEKWPNDTCIVWGHVHHDEHDWILFTSDGQLWKRCLDLRSLGEREMQRPYCAIPPTAQETKVAVLREKAECERDYSLLNDFPQLFIAV